MNYGSIYPLHLCDLHQDQYVNLALVLGVVSSPGRQLSPASSGKVHPLQIRSQWDLNTARAKRENVYCITT